MSTYQILKLRLVPRSIFLLGLIIAGAPPAVFGDESEQPPIRFLLKWGHQGEADGEFNFPIGIAVDSDGTICVSDFYNARVQRFSPVGKFLSSFGTSPNPGGLAIDREGNLYLTHLYAMKLSVHTRGGELLRQWGKAGQGDGEFDYPGGIAVSPTGRIYVADQTNHRVQMFDTDGKFLGKWGEYGTKTGQFGGNISEKARVGGPQFVALDATGNVYTTEASMCRIQKFTSDGKFILAWGEDSEKPGGFRGGWMGGKMQGPVGICLDAEGKVWVSAVNGRVQQYSTTGQYLRGLTEEPGSKPGQFKAPHGVALDGEGNLYVVDGYNHRIQKFATRR
jgi:sugar lactone lactonase YvrE